MDKIGILHLVTARKPDGYLVGFFLCLVVFHYHYKTGGLWALTDLYFTRPEHRKGGLGTKMIAFMETTLRAKKVDMFVSSHKIAHDRSAIFKALGFQPRDIIYSKWIGAPE
jgi:GNAT superfamily N-acetyltransferase